MRKLKGLLKSKTFWFNLFSVAAGIPAVLGGALSPEILASISAIGNIGIRLITSQPLENK